MKFKLFVLFILLFSLCFSQNLEDKYDDSYGIFYLEFQIDEVGKATFIDVSQVKCKTCSRKLIHEFKKTAEESFKKSIKNYEKEYFPKANGEEMKFKLPIVFKISDLEK
ncbi:MAG: hypothetical protein PHO74_07400 [Weeksellaceae bacterium]|jgi:hypothetical protein|nr:hypothetical protein [Weeksellaceae bacterium]